MGAEAQAGAPGTPTCVQSGAGVLGFVGFVQGLLSRELLGNSPVPRAACMLSLRPAGPILYKRSDLGGWPPAASVHTEKSNKLKP